MLMERDTPYPLCDLDFNFCVIDDKVITTVPIFPGLGIQARDIIIVGYCNFLGQAVFSYDKITGDMDARIDIALPVRITDVTMSLLFDNIEHEFIHVAIMEMIGWRASTAFDRSHYTRTLAKKYISKGKEYYGEDWPGDSD